MQISALSVAITLASLSLVTCSGADEARDGLYGPRTKPAHAWLKFDKIVLPEAERTTDFVFLPGTDNEILVTSQAGEVRRYKVGGNRADLLDQGTIPGLNSQEGCGLLSVAADPAFAANQFVYISQCIDSNTNRLVRYKMHSLAGFTATETEILTITNPTSPSELWHRWGSMGFEPDGQTLWISMGDNQVESNGQDPATKQSTLLRILPAREDGKAGFAPAAGNMVGPEADPSVYVYGLRSPWRVSRDRLGRFWVGDVGTRTREELNLVTAAGQNFGWDRFEGRCTEACETISQPLVEWGRSSDEIYVREDPDTEPQTRRTIWVGQPYEPAAAGASPDRYFGHFDDMTFFGDYFTGWVRGIRVDEQGRLMSDRLYGHLPRITAWRTGPDGYIYVALLNGGFYRAILGDKAK